MRDLFEDIIIPFLGFGFSLVFIILTTAGIIIGIDSIFKSKECKVWGGEYSYSTGCLVKYHDKILTLEKYKQISSIEIIQPIPHNLNITSTQKDK